MSGATPASPYKGLNVVRGLRARRAALLRPRAGARDRGREPHRVPADGALRAERRREVVAPARGGRAVAAGAARGSARRRLLALERGPGGGARGGRGRATGRAHANGSGSTRSRAPGAGGTSTSSSTRRRSTSSITPTTAGQARSPRRCRRCWPAVPRQRPRLAPRGLAREARPLHGPHSRPLREHAPARPARPRRRRARRSSARSSGRELTGETVAVEPDLVERVLDEVGRARSSRRSAASESSRAARTARGSRRRTCSSSCSGSGRTSALRARASCASETLERLGGAQRIVEEHLEGALAELTDAAEGRRRAHLQPPRDALGNEDRPRGRRPRRLRRRLGGRGSTGARGARPSADPALASRRAAACATRSSTTCSPQPVLEWRTAHEAERSSAGRRRSPPAAPAPARGDRGRQRAPLRVAGVAVFALSQRSEARDQAREARAHQLEAECAAGLPLDPERSLLLAREAARLYRSETAEEALRTALIQSRVRTIVDVGEPLLGAVLNGNDVLAATASGSLVVANGSTGARSNTIATGAPARHIFRRERGRALHR